MSYNELYEWYEYYNDEPFGSDRFEIQMATLSQMVASFGKSKLKHNDFMIRKEKEEKTTPEKLGDKIKNMFSGISKKG